MKAINILACVIATLLIFTIAPHGYAAAEGDGDYARADTKSVYFCTKRDLSSAIFIIPYTYCVKIISEEGDWFYVSYAEDDGLYEKLHGYCKRDGLTRVETPPQNVYLNKPVRVTFRTDDTVGGLPVLGELNVTAAFYGTFYSGPAAYSYVRYDGAFGYVSGANDDYPLNEIPVETPPNDTPASGGGDATKIIIAVSLAALAAGALVVLYFTGRKNKYFTPRQ